MKTNWKLVSLKDQIINYESFLMNAQAVNELFAKVFNATDCKPSNITDIENGISSITEDLKIAKFIVKQCFTDELALQNN